MSERRSRSKVNLSDSVDQLLGAAKDEKELLELAKVKLNIKEDHHRYDSLRVTVNRRWKNKLQTASEPETKSEKKKNPSSLQNQSSESDSDGPEEDYKENNCNMLQKKQDVTL